MTRKKRWLAGLLALTMLCAALPGPARAARSEDETEIIVEEPEALPAPVLEGAENVQGGVALTWQPVEGAAGYRVLRKTGSGKWKRRADVAETRYTDASVTNGKTYTYTVRCLSADGTDDTGEGDEDGFTITFRAAPRLKKVQTVKKGVKITWDKVKGAKRYRVLRKTGGGGWKRVGTTKEGSYTDKSADRCIAYTYTVCCLSADGKTVTSGYDGKGKTITSPNRYDVSRLKAAKKNDQIIVVSVDGGRRRLILYQKKKDGSWEKVLSTAANIGKNGMGKKKEGDHKTPIGNFTFTKALGIKSNPGTRLHYTKVDKTHYWVDDSGSSRYNQLVSTRTYRAFRHGEHIIQYKKVYNYILAISYNKKGTPHKGSAIFLHVWRKKGSPTLGCVAVSESAMKKIMRRVKPGCRIIIDYAGNIQKKY